MQKSQSKEEGWLDRRRAACHHIRSRETAWRGNKTDWCWRLITIIIITIIIILIIRIIKIDHLCLREHALRPCPPQRYLDGTSSFHCPKTQPWRMIIILIKGWWLDDKSDDTTPNCPKTQPWLFFVHIITIKWWWFYDNSFVKENHNLNHMNDDHISCWRYE